MIKLNLEELRAEIQEAYRLKMSRACFGVIVQRHANEFEKMDSAERAEVLRELGVPSSYKSELAKELAVYNYRQYRKINPFEVNSDDI